MRIAIAGGTGLVGRYAVEAAQRSGHEVLVLSRSNGVDVRSGQGLESALARVDAIIDVTNPRAGDRGDAMGFFTDVARHLQSVGAAHCVAHVVTLSIVGIERAPANKYYAAKLRQEQVALGGAIPATVVRATQFHEFAVQMLRRARSDGVAHVPSMRVRSVAARTVGEVLVELTEGPPSSRAPDLGGPEEADLIDLARRFVERYRLHLTIVADPADGTVPYGATVPRAGARLDGPGFEEWLETDDAARLAR
jgi:uncharacterized protein YbjT (DUF2867 family)